MPYDFEYPIDDNTLFILLALRYQGSIKREDIHYFYDSSINYDYTYLKRNNNREGLLSIMQKGLEWINSEFRFIDDIGKAEEPILRIEKKSKLEIFLYYYFLKFRTYEDYYHSIEEHKKVLVKFIEANFQDKKKEELGKKFTYKFTPDTQYKMIQYIGYLIHHGIFAEPYDEREMFAFNNGECGYKKVIRMRFADGCNIESFKRDKKVRGIFYIYTDGDTNVYYKEDNQPICIRPGLKAILYKCIDEDLGYITRKTYFELQDAGKVRNSKGHLSNKRIKDYIEALNTDLRSKFQRDFFGKTNRTGIWEIYF